MDDDNLSQPQGIILDACCVINLFASGLMEEILRTYPVQIFVSKYVKEQEAQRIIFIDGDENQKNVPIDLSNLIENKCVEVVDIDSLVMNQMIVLAQQGLQGMGEKITVSIAFIHNWGVGTDDKHVIKTLGKLAPKIPIITTLDFVCYWAEKSNVTGEIVKDVLNKIRLSANYEPSPNHPQYNRLQKLLAR